MDTDLTSDKDYYYILEVVSANGSTYNAGTTSRTASRIRDAIIGDIPDTTGGYVRIPYMTPEAVRQAKFRVLRHLRTELDQLFD